MNVSLGVRIDLGLFIVKVHDFGETDGGCGCGEEGILDIDGGLAAEGAPEKHDVGHSLGKKDEGANAED